MVGGRSVIRLSLALVLPLLAVLAGAAPAQAEGYRYWSFWQRGGDGAAGRTRRKVPPRPGPTTAT